MQEARTSSVVYNSSSISLILLNIDLEMTMDCHIFSNVTIVDMGYCARVQQGKTQKYFGVLLGFIFSFFTKL